MTPTTGAAGPIEIQQSELTREEQLELALAETRAREAQLAAAIAQRAVVDLGQALTATRQRLVEAALERRRALVESAAADELARDVVERDAATA
ncbi:MAG: hypothetical protein IT379_39370 [Deltaproteobacteria bacterium]|nr:hypothetical protein [Deltaproteobacteria bacterium]